jgi:hypothetical protein
MDRISSPSNIIFKTTAVLSHNQGLRLFNINMATTPQQISPISNVLVEGNLLNKIPYSERPLALGGEIVYLTHEEFKAKFNCEYSESLLGDRENLALYLENEVIISSLDVDSSSKIAERLNNPISSLVICKINDKVGYGVFASENIPAHTVIGTYAGEIKPCNYFIDSGDPYGLLWCHKTQDLELEYQLISAKNEGNVIRFMQNLPEQDSAEFHDIQLRHGITKDQLATGNVYFKEVLINGIPVMACFTWRNIIKGEQLGYSYGEKCCLSVKLNPRYFDRSGNIIALSDYHFASAIVKIYIDPVTRDLNEETAKKLFEEVKNEDIPNKRYQQAIEKTKAILKAFLRNKNHPSYNIATCFFVLAFCYKKLEYNNIAEIYAQITFYIGEKELAKEGMHQELTNRAFNMVKTFEERIRSLYLCSNYYSIVE